MDAERAMVLVHAHPDDETISTGVTMAAAVAAGVRVTLVTCTRGEQGEVIPAELGHLSGDALGAHRSGELRAAMAVLGVGDHRFLGDEAGRTYRDSGMVRAPDGSATVPPDLAAGAFAAAGLDQAAAHLVDLLLEVRPAVVITYDPGGGYGHPDHVQAHRVTMRAVHLAVASGLDAPAVYWVVAPRSEYVHDDRLGPLPSMAVPDGEVTHVVDAPGLLGAKAAALAEHATQVVVARADGGWTYTLSHGIEAPLLARECFRRVGAPVPHEGPLGTDLFLRGRVERSRR